jgi:hypothetical protein
VRKLLGVVFVVALVLVVAIGVGIYYSANVVQQVVQRVGSDVTGVEVTLREVDLSDLTDGFVAGYGLRVGNPERFQSEYAIDISRISTTLELATLRAETLVIREIVLEAPSLVYEYLDGRSNFGRIQRNVDASLAARRPAEREPGDTRSIIIENLHVRGARAAIVAPQLGREVNVDLPPLHLTDLGAETGGITAAEIVARVFAELHRHMTEAVVRHGLPEVSAHADRARYEAEAAADAVRERAREARDRVGERAGDTLRDLGDSVRGRRE